MKTSLSPLPLKNNSISELRDFARLAADTDESGVILAIIR